MTPPSKLPSKLHTSARAVAASTSRARQESVPTKKATSARKAPAKKASLKSVESPPAKKGDSAQPVAEEETALAAEPAAADDAVDEVDLEEIYYYRIDRPEGYAIQKVYTADRRIDETLSVRDGELVLIPEGYHPVVAAHGYNVYYLNALAGSA